MITWFGWIQHSGQGLLMEHRNFEFWILVGFESWWCDLGLPKDGRSRGRELFLDTHFWGSKDNYCYFVVENHKFYFW